jgi:hypothetical protein
MESCYKVVNLITAMSRGDSGEKVDSWEKFFICVEKATKKIICINICCIEKIHCVLR